MFFLAALAEAEKRLMRFWSFRFFAAVAAGPRMFYTSRAERFAAWCGSPIRDAAPAQSRVILGRMDRAQSRVGFLISISY